MSKIRQKKEEKETKLILSVESIFNLTCHHSKSEEKEKDN